MSIALDLADALKGGISDQTDGTTVTSFMQTCIRLGSAMQVQWFLDVGLTNAQAALVMRGAIVDRMNRIGAVTALAASHGYLLPDSPSARLQQVNANRRLFQPLGIDSTEEAALGKAAVELSELAVGYDAGTVTFDRHESAAQLASYEVSVDGISPQSGDALVDILGYQPDADYVKRKRALDSLVKLDFSKRKPYLLFTADVIRGGRRTSGTIVCWMKMRDASAYRISRRNVFAAVDLPDVTVSNADLESSTSQLLSDENFKQLLSFYDWVMPGDVWAYPDVSTDANTLYSYRISGLQRRAPASPFIFDVPSNSLYLSAAQQEDVLSLIDLDLERFARGSDRDSVSPYPAIAQEVYGDSGFAWILAGCNVLASVRRGDSDDVVRSYSYLGARASGLLAAASSGKLVVPTDVGQVQRNVDQSVSSYGVSQTLLAVMDGAGVTMFVSGKDDPTGVEATQASLDSSTGGLAKILATIDPESATVDPHVLAAALTTHGDAAPHSRYKSVSLEFKSLINGGHAAPSISSMLGDSHIDLTTYAGISQFIAVIRLVYDFYPGALS